MREARDTSGYTLAISSYRDALRAAPWWGDAYFNLSKPAEARQYAEKVVGDEQFGERAKEILSRLAKSPQP